MLTLVNPSAMFGPRGRVAQFLMKLLAAATLRRYEEALTSFQTWCSDHQLPFEDMSEEDQDWLLGDYILHLRDEDFPLQHARDVVSALQEQYPRRRFTTAWKVVNGWARERPPEQAPPLPQDVAMAMVILLISVSQPGCGIAVLPCFCGLLRIGEALKLRVSDLVFSPSTVVLLLADTKTGTHQRVVLTNVYVIQFLRSFITHYRLQNNDFVCGVSCSKFRVWFSRAAAVLGCRAIEFRSHSCRRGGATELFHANIPLPTIMIFGRWASESSCRLYVKSGESALVAVTRDMDPEALQRAKTLGAIGLHIFDLLLGKRPNGGKG